MALGIGNAANGSRSGHGTSITFTLNCNGNLLIVGVAVASNSSSLVTNMAVTFNGVAMTLIGSETNSRHNVYLFKLADPSQGSYSVAVTWTNDGWGMAFGQAFTGAQSETGTFASADAATVNVTSAVGEYVIDCMACADTTITVGAGQTQIAQTNAQSDSGDTSGDWMVGAGSYEAGAASVTMDWTGVATAKCICGVSIKPSAGQQVIMF